MLNLELLPSFLDEKDVHTHSLVDSHENHTLTSSVINLHVRPCDITFIASNNDNTK